MDDHGPVDEWVTPQGTFIGSTGMLFVDQTAADIYFFNYWYKQGLNLRMAVVCMGWGMSMLYIQEGTRTVPPTQWGPAPLAHGFIDVEDHGTQPANGQNMVPAAIRNVQAGAPAVYFVSNYVVTGLRLPWHRRILVTRKGKAPMHYHQHVQRTKHEAHIVPDIEAQGGAHVTFRVLVYGSQVSSFRRAQGPEH